MILYCPTKHSHLMPNFWLDWIFIVLVKYKIILGCQFSRLTGWVNSPTKSFKAWQSLIPWGWKSCTSRGLHWAKKRRRRLHGVDLKNTLWLKRVYEISIKSRVHTRTGFSLPLLFFSFFIIILCFICLLLFLSSHFN